MTRPRRRFTGPRVRRLREQSGWSQKQLAERLSLSLSYVSQIENNQRPVTAGVLLKLAATFGDAFLQFSEDDERRRLAELDASLRDRSLLADPLPATTLARTVEQAPELVAAFLALIQRHARLQEEYAQTLDRYYGEPGADFAQAPLPPEAVRDYLNRRDNYVDRLDRLGEALVDRLGLRPGQRAAALKAQLHSDCRIDVRLIHDDEIDGSGWLRRLDRQRGRLDIPARLTDAQQAFQLATQYALLVHAEVIEEELADSGFDDPATRALARQGCAHYFAGAVLLPYRDFLAQARAWRYDLELLQQGFHVGFETVCHRLSTLQRPGERGVPFYFVRLDQAGNISKRQSASAFHFARHGGACPLWHVHEAFAQPERILTQVVEMPDGSRFFGIARTSSRGGGGFRSRRKTFAIGLGCELTHAGDLVYADGIDLAQPRDVVPIGPGCRVCPRTDCVQRAFPPAGKALDTDTDLESLVSYRFAAD